MSEFLKSLKFKNITRTFAVTDREDNILKISAMINDFVADKEVIRLDYWGGCVGVIATVTVKVPIEKDDQITQKEAGAAVGLEG